MRIIFMGTPEFAVPSLEALLRGQKAEPFMSSQSGAPYESQETFMDAIEVVAVYSQPPRPAGRGMKLTPSPVHQLADKHGIPVYTPASLKSAEAQTEFAALKADVAVVVAYGLLLPQPILDAPKYGCINIHPSKLPRWRGAAPIKRTVMAGDKDTEICIMQMDAGLDTGPVYKRSASISIPDTMNAGTLHDLLAKQSAPLLLDVLASLPATPTPQSDNGVEYAAKITKEDCVIDWNKPAIEIMNQIRGLSPTPGAFTTLSGEILKVYEAELVSSTIHHPPSTTIDDALTIGCGSGALKLKIVQSAGKQRVSAEEFLHGRSVPAGTVLG